MPNNQGLKLALNREEIELRRLEYRYRRSSELIRMFFVIYLAIIVGAGLAFLAINGKSPFHSSSEDTSSVQQRVSQLDNEVTSLQAALKKASQQPNNGALSSRVDDLDSRLSALSATIMVDPDKALTSRLLRDQQINIENEVKDLKSDDAALRQDMINFIIAILAVPLAGGAITYLIDRFKGSKAPESLSAGKG